MLAELVKTTETDVQTETASVTTTTTPPDAALRTNALPTSLGTGMMELLYDLLFLPSGPRIRDRLSHGEIKFRLKRRRRKRKGKRSGSEARVMADEELVDLTSRHEREFYYSSASISIL